MKTLSLATIGSICLSIAYVIGTVATVLSAPSAVKDTAVKALVVLGLIYLIGLLWIANRYFGVARARRILIGAQQVGLINLQKDRLHGSNLIKENLKNAKMIRLFGVSGNHAIPDYGEELRHALADNASTLLVIFAMQGGLVYDEDIEAKKQSGINESVIKDVAASCALLSEYLREASSIAQRSERVVGTIEVGFFDIHNRVPMLICDSCYAAFHLSLPPKRSNESVFFEVEGGESVPLKDGRLIHDLITHFDLNWNYLKNNSLTGPIDDHKRLLEDFTQINRKAHESMEQNRLTAGAAYYFNKKKDDRNLVLGQADDVINHHFGIGEAPHDASSLSQVDIAGILSKLERSQIDTMIEFMRPIERDQRILDAGCGRGGTSIVISQNFDVEIVGINISDYQVAFANDIVKKRALQRIQFRVMDYLSPEFPDDYFDHVVVNEVTQYALSLPRLFAGFQRVLKREGRITVATWCMREDYSGELWASRINEHYGLRMHTIGAYVNALTPLFGRVRSEDYSRMAQPYFTLRNKWTMRSGVEPYFMEGFSSNKLVYLFITATEKKMA